MGKNILNVGAEGGSLGKGKRMQYVPPTVVEFGSIGGHTYSRCPSGNPSSTKPKDWQDYPHDKFGECSSGHALS